MRSVGLPKLAASHPLHLLIGFFRFPYCIPIIGIVVFILLLSECNLRFHSFQNNTVNKFVYISYILADLRCVINF